MNFLVTTISAEMGSRGVDVHLFGRTADDPETRQHVTVKDFPLTFSVRSGEWDDAYLGDSGVLAVDHDTGFSPFRGQFSVSEVTYQPSRKRDATSLFSETFNANISWVNQFRIRTGVTDWVAVPDHSVKGGNRAVVSVEEVEAIEPPVELDPEPRVVTFDIEVDDRGDFPEPGERRITGIVAHDSYEREYQAFFDGDSREIAEMFPDGKPEEVDAVHVEADETRMLIHFASWLSDRDPDVLTAWNSDFDVPYLVERMKRVGANPARLSPLDTVDQWGGDLDIKGLEVYDLLVAYKKNSYGELRKYTLDYVAQEELGESKIDFEGSFWNLYRSDPETFVNYNARDVRLAVGINREAGVIEFRDTLRKQVGVEFSETVDNYQFVEMMCRRKLHERREVARDVDGTTGEGYEGAFVFEPSSGVLENVVGIDVESLYPWTMYMLNASPETKTTATGAGMPVTEAPNGARFHQMERGLFPSLVEDGLALKEDFRELRDNAEPGSDEQAMYAVKYASAKTITNSLYGTTGWDKFFLYDREVAEAVTLAGQAVIKATAEYVDAETEATVAYGDTDSNYIKFPTDWSATECIEVAEVICAHLEVEVYPEVAAGMGMNPGDCEWRIGPEMYAERFLQWGKKKKYAYKATWKEGMDPTETMDEPEYVVKGSASKRSDSSRLTRDTEKKIIRALLDGNDEAVNGYIYEAAKKIDPADPDWEAIGIPGGIRKPLTEYDSPTAHVRAATYANALCGTNFEAGSKPMRCYLVSFYADDVGGEVDVIGYEDADDLRPVEDRLTVDAARMTDTLLVNPMGEMLEAVGVDVDAAVSGQTQSGLGAFL